MSSADLKTQSLSNDLKTPGQNNKEALGTKIFDYFSPYV